jgi:hypothetical protein
LKNLALPYLALERELQLAFLGSTIDADCQHSPERIPAFMAESSTPRPAMILGVPVFDAGAPRLRVQSRRASNCWANLETTWMHTRLLAGFVLRLPVLLVRRVLGRF